MSTPSADVDKGGGSGSKKVAAGKPKKAKTKSKTSSATAPKQQVMKQPEESIGETIAGAAVKKAGTGHAEDGVEPEPVGKPEEPPTQEDMDDIDKPAENIYRAKTTLGKDIVFFEALHWCGCVDMMQRQCCVGCCCGYTEYTVSNVGLQVRSIYPCSEATNNVDWTAFESVDYETGCCYGYLDLNTRDSDCGDMVLRVKKGEGQELADVLFNLSCGDSRNKSDDVVREVQEACHCCDPCAFLTSYTITKRALKIKHNRCLPCMGFEARNLRYLNKHGTDNIVDIDSAEDCCFGYIYVYTHDSKPEYQHVTMRLKKADVEGVMSDLRSFNSSAAGKSGRAVTSFQQVGWCCGLFDSCTPGFCRACDTQYLVTDQGLTVKGWNPCRTSTNFVSWDRVLDLDMETTCCLGYLDLQIYDQDTMTNSKLRVEKSKVDELYETIQKLRTYKPGAEEDAIFNHFKEARCLECIWALCDSCTCPTRYVLKRTGVEVEKTSCGCCTCSTIKDHMKWDRVRDVDYETDCCFGYVIMETWDDKLGDMKLRVRKGQAEKFAGQIHNRSLGRNENEEAPELLHFRRAGCCNCLSCCSTNYILTSTALKVRSNWCMKSHNNNIAWARIRDVDGDTTCCCSYIRVQSADRVVRDQDRSADPDDPKQNLKAGGKKEAIEEVVLRVWPWNFEKAFEAVRNIKKGDAFDAENTVALKYHPRGWCDFLTCYRGYCWFYHPTEYQVTKNGFQIKRTPLCSSSGICPTHVNSIDWVQVREIDSSTTCCWAELDMKTLDDEDPQIKTRLLNSEIEDVIKILRDYQSQKRTE